MNIVFFGSGAFGLHTLERLAEHHTIRAVVTQPDRPAGRGKKLTPTPIAAFCEEAYPNLLVLKPQDVNNPDIVRTIRELGPPGDFTKDLCAWVVIAFGQKLGKPLLADEFAINLHASLLPRWRGAAPINHAILAGDTETGNSVITLADRMDAGLVLGQSRRTIEPDQTAGELHDLLAADGPDLVDQVLHEFATGSLAPRVQDETKVTLASKLRRADASIDFSLNAGAIRNKVHGLTPWPGVSVELEGNPIKLLRVEARVAEAGDVPSEQDGSRKLPGTLIDPTQGLVACGSGVLRLIDVQPAGKRPMPWQDFIRGSGRAIQPGSILTVPTPPPPPAPPASS